MGRGAVIFPRAIDWYLFVPAWQPSQLVDKVCVCVRVCVCVLCVCVSVSCFAVLWLKLQSQSAVYNSFSVGERLVEYYRACDKLDNGKQ